MVDVDVVVDDNFPVCLDLILGAPFGILDKFFDLVRAELRLDVAEPFDDGPGIRIGVHEEHATPEIDRRRLQPEAGFLDAAELALFLRDGLQFSLKVVSPIVVGASDRLLRLADGAQQLGSAVPADIVKSPPPPIPPHDDEQVVQAGLHRDVLAGFADVFGKILRSARCARRSAAALCRTTPERYRLRPEAGASWVCLSGCS